MDKIVAILEQIEDQKKTWKQIYEYCRKIGIDPRHARKILTDLANPLVIESSSGVRPNLKGHEMVAKQRKTVSGDQVGDVTIKVRGSEKFAIVTGGRGHTINFPQQQKPVRVPPYDSNELSTINIGKWIMRKLFGTLDHDLRLFTLVTSALTAVAGTPVIGQFVPGSPFTFNSPNYLWIQLAGLFSLFLIFLFGWNTIVASWQTRCHYCGQRFSWTIKDKWLTNTQELSDGEVRNYKVTRFCDNPACGRSETVTETEMIPYESDSEEESD